MAMNEKAMIYHERDIEYLETLPLRLGITAFYSQNKGKRISYGRGYKRSKRRTLERDPMILVKFMLRKYVNKPFDDMYSEWSKRIKSKDLFRQEKYLIKWRLFQRQFYGEKEYCVDDNGIVRLKKRVSRKKKYPRIEGEVTLESKNEYQRFRYERHREMKRVKRIERKEKKEKWGNYQFSMGYFDLLLSSIPQEWTAKYGEIKITNKMTPEVIKGLINEINFVKDKVGMGGWCLRIKVQRQLYGANRGSPPIDTSNVYFTDNRVFNKLFGKNSNNS